MSTRSHDKTVEMADNPVYDVLFFWGFFVNRFFVCFQESFNTTVSSRYNDVCSWIFFLLEMSCCYFRIALFLNALLFFFFFFFFFFCI